MEEDRIEEQSIASQTVNLPSTVVTTPAEEILRQQRRAESIKGRVLWNRGREHCTGMLCLFLLH
jgi:hypothetical protein